MDLKIDKVIRETAFSAADPNDRAAITRAVLAQIPESDYREALTILIYDRISQALGQARNSAITQLKAGTAELQPDKTETVQAAQTFIGIDDAAAPIKVNTSKRDKIRESFFAQIIPVKDGKVKRLGELTESDLRYVASVRKAMADANLHQANAYTSLANLLRDNKYATLSEAPLKDVRDTLTGH